MIIMLMMGFDQELLVVYTNDDITSFANSLWVNDLNALKDAVTSSNNSNGFQNAQLANYSNGQETISSIFFEYWNPVACDFECAESSFSLLKIFQESSNLDLKNDLINYFNENDELIDFCLENFCYFNFFLKTKNIREPNFFMSIKNLCMCFCEFFNDIDKILTNHNIKTSRSFFFNFWLCTMLLKIVTCVKIEKVIQSMI